MWVLCWKELGSSWDGRESNRYVVLTLRGPCKQFSWNGIRYMCMVLPWKDIGSNLVGMESNMYVGPCCERTLEATSLESNPIYMWVLPWKNLGSSLVGMESDIYVGITMKEPGKYCFLHQGQAHRCGGDMLLFSYLFLNLFYCQNVIIRRGLIWRNARLMMQQFWWLPAWIENLQVCSIACSADKWLLENVEWNMIYNVQKYLGIRTTRMYRCSLKP